MISKIGNPDIFNPSRMPNYWYFSSTNVNEEGFKYYIQLFSAGTSTQLGEPYSVWPRPVDKYCEINLNQLKDYVQFEVFQNLSGFSTCPNTWASYNIEVGEQYIFDWNYDDYYFYTNSASTYNAYVQLTSYTEDHQFVVGDLINVVQESLTGQTNISGVQTVVEVPSSDSVVIGIVFSVAAGEIGGTVKYSDSHKTTYSALTGYSSYTVFNAAIDHKDYINYDYNDFLISTANSDARFLTNCPNNYIINANNNVYLNFYSTATTIHSQFLYITNSNGDSFRIPQGSLSGANQTMMTVNVGPLDYPNSIEVISGSLPVVKSSTTRFDVYLSDSAGTTSSEIKTFFIEQDCWIYPGVEIYFFDKLGSLIPVNFELNSKRAYNYQREEYKHKIGDLSNGKYRHNSTEAGSNILSITEGQTMTAHKEKLTTDERLYFKELIGTRQAYIKEDGYLWPIIITDSNYEELTEFNENWMPFIVNFRYANNNIL